MKSIELLEKLHKNQFLSRDEFIFLLENVDEKVAQKAADLARMVAEENYGDKIYIRGLIEFTNICKNNCYYCGIRAGNNKVVRYRLNKDEIYDCVEYGYDLGFRTFVLQGGEDEYFTDEIICEIISEIKNRYPDCAVTLSIGEKSKESYSRYKMAGADRYLLRHETADIDHYKKLHPESMSGENRHRCLEILKELGFQVGAGFMVGSPYQTVENVADDLIFMKKLNPEMVGIGPFIPAGNTPFENHLPGELNQTLFILSLIRLMLPEVLLPATTALSSLDSRGRELGIKAGANVVMPNLSPPSVRDKYYLYDNKAFAGEEAAEHLEKLKKSMKSIGREVVVDRGDNIGFKNE